MKIAFDNMMMGLIEIVNNILLNEPFVIFNYVNNLPFHRFKTSIFAMMVLSGTHMHPGIVRI